MSCKARQRMRRHSMRYLIGIILGSAIAACRPVTPPPPKPYPNPVPQSVVVSVAAATPAIKASARVPATPPTVRIKSINGITFEGVAFDTPNHRLEVVDQTEGPGSLHADAAAAARSAGGIAAINAGYFTPEGEPLGLVIDGGRSTGAWNSGSSLGSGIWYADSAGSTAIVRRENLGPQRGRSMDELIQSGPMLVHEGRGVTGLEATKPAIRSLIAWDGGSQWWIGRTSACTLAELGRALGSSPVAGWPVYHALNLDGGRSADLWVSGAIAGGPLTRRPMWNRPVRNFLVLMP